MLVLLLPEVHQVAAGLLERRASGIDYRLCAKWIRCEIGVRRLDALITGLIGVPAPISLTSLFQTFA